MKIRSIDHEPGDGHPDFMFWCPACKCGHGIWTTSKSASGGGWKFNGNIDKPTIEPSVLVETTTFTDKGWQQYNVWSAAGYPDRKGEPFDSKPLRCHSVVTDGVIHYCADCSHELAGKAVPMEDF